MYSLQYFNFYQLWNALIPVSTDGIYQFHFILFFYTKKYSYETIVVMTSSVL